MTNPRVMSALLLAATAGVAGAGGSLSEVLPCRKSARRCRFCGLSYTEHGDGHDADVPEHDFARSFWCLRLKRYYLENGR